MSHDAAMAVGLGDTGPYLLALAAGPVTSPGQMSTLAEAGSPDCAFTWHSAAIAHCTYFPYGRLCRIERVFGKLVMCAVRRVDRGDLTARAVIRDQALRLFAVHGPEAVSLRRVAAAAGVSPGLVVHHFGSRAGLREAVDAHVAGLFDELFTTMGEADWRSPTVGASFAEALLAQLPPDSPVPAYLRRLLLSGDAAGHALFARWYALTSQVLDELTAAGIMRPAADPQARAAFLMVNDLAALVMREHLAAVLGVDPLSPDGAPRWAENVIAVYRDGVFTSPPRTPQEDR
jgi:AcrR family transcriptional regulator